MSARGKLLYLAREFPIPVSSAARLRTYNWVLHLSRHFDLTFVSPVRSPIELSHREALEPYCARVLLPQLRPRRPGPRTLAGRLLAEARYLATGLPPEAWWFQRGQARAAIEELRRDEQFDVVFSDRWTWGPAALEAAPRRVLDAAALHASRIEAALEISRNPLRRWLRRHILRGLAHHEARAVSRATLVLTMDPASRRAVGAVAGEERTLMLPAGLCTRYFSPRRTQIDPSNVLFFGSMSSASQRDALVHLQQDLMPLVRQRLRHAHVTVVDEDPIPELANDDGDRLHFTGSLEDERTVLWHGAVAAFPLRFGSGPRTRIAQLLAMGIPVVATRTAVRGLGLRSGDGVLVAHDGPEFAKALTQALIDASLRDDLSRRAREVALSRLSITATYDRVSQLLAQDVLSG
jgi:glycosyltransferase involved in cell wall biosynthesis